MRVGDWVRHSRCRNAVAIVVYVYPDGEWARCWVSSPDGNRDMTKGPISELLPISAAEAADDLGGELFVFRAQGEEVMREFSELFGVLLGQITDVLKGAVVRD